MCGLESKGGVVLPRFRNHWAIVLSQYFSGSNLETFLVVSRMFSSKLYWDTVHFGSGSANPKKAGLPFFTPFFPPHRARVKPGEGVFAPTRCVTRIGDVGVYDNDCVTGLPVKHSCFKNNALKARTNLSSQSILQ